jgi:hypothetical protein
MESENFYEEKHAFSPGLLITHRIKILVPMVQFWNTDEVSQNLKVLPIYTIRESSYGDFLWQSFGEITTDFLERIISEEGCLQVWPIYFSFLKNYPAGRHFLNLTGEFPASSVDLTIQLFENEFGTADPYLIPSIIKSRSILDFSPLMTPGDLIQKLFNSAYNEFVIVLRKALDKKVEEGIIGLFPGGSFFMEPDFRLSSNTFWGSFNQ